MPERNSKKHFTGPVCLKISAKSVQRRNVLLNLKHILVIWEDYTTTNMNNGNKLYQITLKVDKFIQK